MFSRRRGRRSESTMPVDAAAQVYRPVSENDSHPWLAGQIQASARRNSRSWAIDYLP